MDTKMSQFRKAQRYRKKLGLSYTADIEMTSY